MDIGNTQHIETKAQFARRMGWNKSSVTRGAEKGRVVLCDGMVDVDATLARLRETASKKPHHIAHVEQLKEWRSAGLFHDVAERMKKWKSARERDENLDAAKKQRRREYFESVRADQNQKACARMARAYADPERRRKMLDRLKVLKESVPEWYARSKLGMTKKDAPAELVQAKRLHLLIKKQIGRLKDEKH
jgi:hypothetical protein